jgi:hypothetical protein
MIDVALGKPTVSTALVFQLVLHARYPLDKLQKQGWPAYRTFHLVKLLS